MTIEEKLKLFMDISVNGAYEKGQLMLEEYKIGMDKIFEEHRAESLATAETYMRTAKSGIKRNLSKDFSKQQTDIRRQLTEKQNELKEKIFSEVIDALEEYKKTEDYTKLLIKYIRDSISVAQNKEIEIFIDPEDSDKLKYLSEQTDFEIKISESSFMGGMKAIIPAKNIIIDNSFESKFDLEKENFVIGL